MSTQLFVVQSRSGNVKEQSQNSRGVVYKQSNTTLAAKIGFSIIYLCCSCLIKV